MKSCGGQYDCQPEEFDTIELIDVPGNKLASNAQVLITLRTVAPSVVTDR